MRYSVEGFSQSALVAAGLDNTDAVVLRWFVDFTAGGGMVQKQIDGAPFLWVKYQAVIDDLPCLGITNREAMAARFKKLVGAGVLDHRTYRVGGTFSMYRVVAAGLAALTNAGGWVEPESVDGEKAADESPHVEVIKRYHDLFVQSTGKKPMITAATGRQVKGLLARRSVDEIGAALDAYFRGEFWFAKGGARSFQAFAQHYDEIVSGGMMAEKPKSAIDREFEVSVFGG